MTISCLHHLCIVLLIVFPGLPSIVRVHAPCSSLSRSSRSSAVVILVVWRMRTGGLKRDRKREATQSTDFGTNCTVHCGDPSFCTREHSSFGIFWSSLSRLPRRPLSTAP
ncbi:hypothetical protein EV424DRAFT_573975 [Suillus variegatus]|nr:hypothetical protein EV424DRAFT_573975 [Suillus variegatus]